MTQSTNWTARFAEALNYEKNGYATGPVTQDPFYTVSAEWDEKPLGTMFRVEGMNASAYTLPPGISGMRMLYQSENFNGTKTPASGAILFPYSPRKTKDGTVPVVVWAHGTSSLYPNGAPSHLRDLWQHFVGPFPLALQGYIVVMPDYAGLGVSVDSKGSPIVHEYLANPAAAKDLEYAFKATRSAYPKASHEFVVMGHSQGGGVVWSFAERMHTHPMQGYLGVIPISPVTNILSEPMPMRGILAAGSLWGMQNIFPDFDMNCILSDEGKERMKADKDLGGNVGITKFLYFGTELFVPGWEENEHVKRFNELVHGGGRPIAGPMLLIQGETDPLISFPVVKAAAEETAKVSPDVSIEYHQYPSTGHVPANWVSQRLWLDWIKDRFDGKETTAGLKTKIEESLRPSDEYPVDMNWYVGYATEPYHTP
ncbi:hypothetical protein N0V90_010074 [Kalmusia sp. IMI 367209]|nr:hypothetical protein N0V90_010074 [Kalmusia sp. IMI 367209]